MIVYCIPLLIYDSILQYVILILKAQCRNFDVQGFRFVLLAATGSEGPTFQELRVGTRATGSQEDRGKGSSGTQAKDGETFDDSCTMLSYTVIRHQSRHNHILSYTIRDDHVLSFTITLL